MLFITYEMVTSVQKSELYADLIIKKSSKK